MIKLLSVEKGVCCSWEVLKGPDGANGALLMGRVPPLGLRRRIPATSRRLPSAPGAEPAREKISLLVRTFSILAGTACPNPRSWVRNAPEGHPDRKVIPPALVRKVPARPGNLICRLYLQISSTTRIARPCGERMRIRHPRGAHRFGSATMSRDSPGNGICARQTP